MRFFRLLFYLLITAVTIGLLYVFLTGGLPHRVAEGILASPQSTQPETAPARSMYGDIQQQEDVMREFMESVPSPGTSRP